MSFWSRLISLRRRQLDDSPAVDRIFKKLERIVSDDEPPISHLPADGQNEILSGPEVDELPKAVGLFGHELTNPIPVRGPIGQVSYLSRLVTQSGESVFGHRIGHFDRIDVYEIVGIDGVEWDILYLSMYHPRNSRKAPRGYSHAQTSTLGPLFTCVNFEVKEFPSTMDVAIRSFTSATLGFPLCPTKLGQYIESIDFTRPAEHLEKLRDLDILGMEPSLNSQPTSN